MIPPLASIEVMTRIQIEATTRGFLRLALPAAGQVMYMGISIEGRHVGLYVLENFFWASSSSEFSWRS